MSIAHTTTTSRAKNAVRGATKLFNPLLMKLAGTRFLPLYGVIQHRGRRSGKDFRTPVVVRPVDDGFIVPMPWGERTDWYRNVRAAGGCLIRWNGRDYPVVHPEVIDGAAARVSFSGFERAAMKGLHIDQCLRLYHQRVGVGSDAQAGVERVANRVADKVER
jgi:deazaflavin-dependent oxidoreductase (nitroreductase family)